MKRLAACALLLLVLSLSGCLLLFRDRSVGGWESVGSSRLAGSQAAPFSLALDSDGVLYVAHATGDLGAFDLLVSRFFEGGWSGITPGITESPSPSVLRLLIGTDEQPIACFATSSASVVRLYDGSSWTAAPELPVDPDLGWSPYGQLLGAALAPDGTLRVLVPDDDHERRVTLLKLEGAAWSVVGDRGFSDALTSAACLGWNAAGELYVAFDHDTGDWTGPAVFRLDGSTWVPVGADSLPSSGFLGTFHGANTQALAFESSDQPCISVLRYVDTVLVPFVLAFDGSAWVVVGGEAIVGSNSLSIALATGPDDLLYTAVAPEVDREEVSVFRFSDGAWEAVGTRGFTTANHAEDAQIAFGPDGAIYVAYIATGHDYEVQVMRHPGFGSP